jgi:TrmH family RNA methyltransferase
MLSKAIIKLIRSLDQKKIRVENSLFVVEGNKIVGEILNSKLQIKYLIAVKEWLTENKKLPKTEIFEVTEKELQQISFQKSPQRVFAVCEIPNKELYFDDLKNSLSLALDDIQDPGNLGTIIRIADWFGIKNIIASPATADLYNPKVIQATMGAFARVNVHYHSLSEFLKKAKSEISLNIYGTTLNGENIYKQKLADNGIIVMGSEGNGISKEVLKVLTKQLYIPSFKSDSLTSESLNVATATAIICAEFRRQEYL